MDAPLALGSLYGPTKSRKTTHTLEAETDRAAMNHEIVEDN